MPTYIASATKQNLRQAVEPQFPYGAMSSAGAVGGTTGIDTKWTNRQVDYWTNQWRYLLLTSGTYSGQFREIGDWNSGTSAWTFINAFGGQVASGVTYEVYHFSPDQHWKAANEAIQAYFPALCRPVLGITFPPYSNAGVMSRGVYGVPRNMRDVLAVSLGGSRMLRDVFDRADSTLSAGGSWVATAGTPGISSERFYFASDANADFATYDAVLEDGFIRCVTRGTLNSGATYRSIAIAFRINEDYTGAIDTNNYLVVRLLNGSVDLRKMDAGSESSLTTGSLTTSDAVDYVVDVLFEGPRIKVFVDEVMYIDYELLGLNLKYLSGQRIGLRLDKAGSPATNARADSFYAYKADWRQALTDWQQAGDRTTVELGAFGHGRVSDDHFLYLEGRAPLSTLAVDTTYGTLLTDTTATMEILTSDPEWHLLVEGTRLKLWEMAPDHVPDYNNAIVLQAQRVEQLRRLVKTPGPRPVIRGPA